MPLDIKLYCADWCADCAHLCHYFRLNEVKFQEINIDNTPGALEEMKAINGGKDKIPTVVIGETVLIEPNFNELNKAIGITGSI
jgi:mycoredoxin